MSVFDVLVDIALGLFIGGVCIVIVGAIARRIGRRRRTRMRLEWLEQYRHGVVTALPPRPALHATCIRDHHEGFDPCRRCAPVLRARRGRAT